MTTEITIPDDVYRKAEKAAARMGLSRNEFFAKAVAEYVARHRHSAVTERLDAVYRDEPARVDPVLAAMQWASLPAGSW